MKEFFTKILSPVGKEKTNVYAYMFLCDFFNFLLLIFGFSAFGVSDTIFFFFSLSFHNLAINIDLFSADAAGRWWSDGLFARKPSTHAFPTDVIASICFDSYR